MDFYLGAPLDDAGDPIDDERTEYNPSDLTTHGVIVGMTGSGKTGLGIIYLEEALRQGIPTLVIDPKGDMTNLLLTFPDLTPSDFRPWIDEAAAAKEGRTPDEEAAAEAAKWAKGLSRSGLSGADIAALRETAGMTIYTPGSSAGVPLNVVGELDVPTLSWDEDAEAMRDEIQGYASGLLGLVDVDADPISSREHILIANLIEHSWRNGRSLSLENLISQIAAPPMRKLGVFEVDTFFPEKDRMAFAMKLNGLLASPSFGAWMSGEPIDIEKLLWSDGQPQAAILYLAHLSDSERQFIVATVFSKLITWMRTQSGSSDLRALAYMDEVFGFVPPTAEPPAKKPILTLLKQARAFGVGLLLSTQNPVDLDYKAMSNAGTWCIGRLQTERDKARILEAVTAASGEVDTRAIDAAISGLGRRVFLLHNTRDSNPTTFTTRWAMSYLRGPMTREEIGSVTDHRAVAQPEPSSAQPEALSPAGGTAVAVAQGIATCALDPAAPWSERVGCDPNGTTYEAAAALTVELRFDDTRRGIDHHDRWEAIVFPLPRDPSDAEFIEVDHDDRDFVAPAEGVGYAELTAPISQSSYFAALASTVASHLDRNKVLHLERNKKLGVAARPGESDTDFRARLVAAATDMAEREMADLRAKYEARFRKAKRAYDDAVRQADSAAVAADDERNSDLFGAGLDLLMGRKPKVSRSKARTAANRLRRAEDKIARTRDVYEDLTADLEGELETIEAKWMRAVDDVETIEVGLESDDIEVTDIRLVWVRR